MRRRQWWEESGEMFAWLWPHSNLMSSIKIEFDQVSYGIDHRPPIPLLNDAATLETLEACFVIATTSSYAVLDECYKGTRIDPGLSFRVCSDHSPSRADTPSDR
jgi:hypothetical protein